MPSSIFTQRHRELIGFIASTRKAAGVTRIELAQLPGKPQSFVLKVERGERRLDVIEFCQVLKGLGHDPLTLLQVFLRELWLELRAACAKSDKYFLRWMKDGITVS